MSSSTKASNARSQRRWRERNPEYVKNWQKANPEKAREYRRKWREKNKKKIRVHKAVENEIRRGRLVPAPRETCDHPDTQAHHDDYDKPLEVRWLCDIHHKEAHRKY